MYRSPTNKRNGSISTSGSSSSSASSSLNSPPRPTGPISPLLPALPSRTGVSGVVAPAPVTTPTKRAVEREVDDTTTTQVSSPTSVKAAQIVPVADSRNNDILQRMEASISALQRQVTQLSTQLSGMQAKEREMLNQSEVKSVLDSMLARVSDEAYLDLRKLEWKAFSEVLELELKSRDDEFARQLRNQKSATANSSEVGEQQQANPPAAAAKPLQDSLAFKFEAALQQANRTSTVVPSPSPPAHVFPTLPADDGPVERIIPAKYDVFLSHKRLDCADFCRVLHTELTHRGYSVFLDEEASDDISDLLSQVRASHHVIWVLSSNVFDSAWCLREVRAALRAGIPIQPVVHQGANWGGHDFPPEEWVPSEVSQALSTTKATAYRREYHKEFMTKLAARLGPSKVNAPLPNHKADLVDPLAGRH